MKKPLEDKLRDAYRAGGETIKNQRKFTRKYLKQ